MTAKSTENLFSTALLNKAIEELDRINNDPVDPVHQNDGKWWFWDETWSDRIGPYNTEREAGIALRNYCLLVLGPNKVLI